VALSGRMRCVLPATHHQMGDLAYSGRHPDHVIAPCVGKNRQRWPSLVIPARPPILETSIKIHFVQM
jgi:hypothetical protein